MRRFVLPIMGNELAMLRANPAAVVVLVVMPLVLMGFTNETSGIVMQARGIAGSGAQQSVPGMAVMFSFFLVTFVGYSIFREHGWNTWDRLRATSARPIDVMAGKLLPLVLVSIMQQAVLFGVGGSLFGLTVRGPIALLALIAAAQALALVALGVMLSSLLTSMEQLGAITNFLTILFGGLAGALVPFTALPAWAQRLAPATPPYWAMRGYRSVILGQSATTTLESIAVLLLFTAGFVVVAARRWKAGTVEIQWT